MVDRLKFRVWNKTLGCYDMNDHYLNEDGELSCKGDIYTVEQCTGLKDNTGSLIYVGDVVVMSSYIDSDNYYGEPVYRETKAKGIVRQSASRGAYLKILDFQIKTHPDDDFEKGDKPRYMNLVGSRSEVVGNCNEHKALINEK